MSKSRSGWTLYLMIHFPFVWWVKIGITGKGVKNRAAGIDREMPGFPIPIFFCITPGAYSIEQWLHRKLKPLNVRFYRGSGHSEWFWLPAGAFALVIMSGVWVFWAALVYLAFLALT